jgi:hypothetical protein
MSLTGAEIPTEEKIMGVPTGRTSEPKMTQPWMSANFTQVVMARGFLDAFDWALFASRVRNALDGIKGTRTQIYEVLGKGGEWLAAPEETRVFMIVDPLLSEKSVMILREKLALMSTEYGEVVLVFGTSTLVGE